MVEVMLGVPFGYEANEEGARGLRHVNFCMERAIERNVTSFARIRSLVYEEWKQRWDYSTHFRHSATRIASLSHRGGGVGEERSPSASRQGLGSFS